MRVPDVVGLPLRKALLLVQQSGLRATAVLYKSYSALDGLAGKMDPITLKHYGSAEARTQAGAKRSDLWTTVSSVLGREIMMKP